MLSEREESQDLVEASDPPDHVELSEIWVRLVFQDLMDQLDSQERPETWVQLDPAEKSETVE